MKSQGSSESEEGTGGQDMGQLSMLRMLRLLRLTRMVRMMRSVPELVTLIKSLSIAARPVASTLLLLFCVIYITGIVLKSQLRPTSILTRSRFGRLPDAMKTLLLQGTF